MQRNIIVHRFAGQIIPEEYLKEVQKEKISFTALAIPSKDDGTLMIDKIKEELSLTEFNETQEYYKDIPQMSVFGVGYPEGFSADDMQPFALHDSAGTPNIIAFAEGSFPGFYQEKSSHPNEFFLANTMMAPMLKALYAEHKGDLNKIADALRTGLPKTQLEMSIVNKGLISVFFGNGQLVSFQKGSPMVEFPWGWCTDALAYKAGSYPEQKEDKPVLKGMLARLSAGKATSTVQKQDKVEDTKATETKTDDNKVVELPTTDGPVYVQCPPHIKGNSKIRQWYNDNAGFLPENWKNRPKVVSKIAKGPIKDLKDLGTAMGAGTATAETAVKPEAEAPAENKDVSAHHIPKASEKEEDRVAKPPVLTMNKDEIKVVQDFLKSGVVVGHKTTDGQHIPDPKEINSWETPTPSFAEQVGMESMEPTFGWSINALQQLADKSPTALVILAAQWRSYYLKLRSQAKTAAEEITEATTAPKVTHHALNIPSFKKAG